MRRRVLFPAIILGFVGFVGFVACIRRETSSVPSMQIIPYSGIDHLVHLDENEQQVLSKSKFQPEKKVVDDPDLIALRFTTFLDYPHIGVRVYFRDGLVNLIEVQEPFNGIIQGKRIKLFDYGAPPNGKTWEEVLTRELGQPTTMISGGSLGSFALVFSWGDISFNGDGPNQVALYRDAKLVEYRKKNFGRKLQFFRDN